MAPASSVNPGVAYSVAVYFIFHGLGESEPHHLLFENIKIQETNQRGGVEWCWAA